jgi:hypothetical protein
MWTIAYRRRTGPWFQRVELELTWTQAYYAAMSLGQVSPDLEIYYMTTRQWEAEVVERAKHNSSMAAYVEDVGNLLIHSSSSDRGRRVKVKDTGKLDPRVCILPEHVASRMWGRGAI